MRSFVLLTLAVWNLAACRALDRDRYHQLLEANAAEGGVHDAQSEAAVDAACTANTDGGTVGDGCVLFHAPPRAADSTDLAPDAGVYVFAMRSATFGFVDSTIRATIGLDRDQFCTRGIVGSTQGCNPVGNSASSPVAPVEDGQGGRDNSLATALGSYFSTSNWNEAMLNQSIEIGSSTLGVRVRSLGGPNDAQIEVEWLPIMAGHAMDGTSPPRWDGTDTWSVDSRIAYDPVTPGHALVRSNTGYTTCGTLVARLPARMPLRFGSTRRTIRLTLSGAEMVGPIDPNGHSFGPLDFSAYWNVSDALGDLATLGLCPATTGPNAVLWATATAVINNSADLLSSGESSPPTQCDAISAAFRAIFVPITLGADMMSTGAAELVCP